MVWNGTLFGVENHPPEAHRKLRVVTDPARTHVTDMYAPAAFQANAAFTHALCSGDTVSDLFNFRTVDSFRKSTETGAHHQLIHHPPAHGIVQANHLGAEELRLDMAERLQVGSAVIAAA